jgi:hypothetical protein
MVAIKLLSNADGLIRYSYQPEKSGEPGVLSFNSIKNEPKIEKLAENDMESTFYRNPIFNMIRQNIANLPKERTLAWY